MEAHQSNINLITDPVWTKKHKISICSMLTMKTSTKMCLSLVLSTACIMFYQYQLSKASLLSMQSNSGLVNNNGIENEVVKIDKKTNKFLVFMASVSTPSRATTTTTTTTTTVPSSTTSKKIPSLSSPTNNRLTQTPVTHFSSGWKTKVMTSSTSLMPTTTTIEKQPPLPPPLYIITPTYRRSEQIAEITRLGYTLKHVPNLYWLVIEDAVQPTPLVTRQLKHIGVPFEHLVAPMPNRYKKKKVKPRGVSNRNRGLAWIRKNATNGVFYFADDDNTYDVDIFHQMRYTKKVSMWPVGLVTKYGLSSPIVRNGKLVGFYDGWIGGRRYPIDMAGFAVNVKFFLSRPKAIMPYEAGYEEDKFIRSLAPLNNTEIELLASNCTEILTWHTQTKKNPNASPIDTHKYDGTNLMNLRRIIV